MGNLELNPFPYPFLKMLVSKCSSGRPECSKNGFRSEKPKITELMTVFVFGQSINQPKLLTHVELNGQYEPSQCSIDWLTDLAYSTLWSLDWLFDLVKKEETIDWILIS